MVRVDRVVSVLLKDVRAQLVHEPHATRLLPGGVYEHATSFLPDGT